MVSSATIVIGIDVIWGKLYHFGIVCDSKINIAVVAVSVTTVVMDLGIVWV